VIDPTTGLDPAAAPDAASFQGDALDYQNPAAPAPAPADTLAPAAPALTPTPAPAGLPPGTQMQVIRQPTPAPGELEAQAQADKLGKEAAEATGDVSRAKADQLREQTDAKAEEGVDARLEAQELQDKADEHERIMAAVRARADEAEQAVADHKFHEFGSDHTLGDRVMGKIAAGLGDFNLSGHGTGHEGTDRLNRLIDRDFDKQKAELLTKENIAKWRRAGVTDANAQYQDELGALKIKQAKFHEAAAAKALSLQLRSGIPVEEAQASAVVKGQLAAAAKARAEGMRHLEGSITTQYGQRTAPKAKGGGKGGGGSGASLEKFVAAVNALPVGAAVTPEIYTLGRAAGYKVNQVSSEVDRIRASGSKAAGVGSRAELAGERVENLKGSLDVTDENGNFLGKADDAAAAKKLRTQIPAFDQFRQRMTALRDYVKEHGPRAWSIDEIQHRDSLGAAAAAAGRVYNGLGGTDASQKLEAEINGARGTPGHGWMSGANLDVLDHNIAEAQHQHQTRLNTSLRKSSPGVQPHDAGAAARPHDAPVGTTKVLANGTTVRKVGPNNWQPVTP